MSWSERRLGRRAFAAATAGSAALLVAGCGFELRAPPKLAFGTIALTGFAPRSPLGESLRRQLAVQAKVVEAPERAEVILRALDDRRDKSVVASTSAAQVRELQLRVRFDFRVETPSGRELLPRVALLVSRDLSYSETTALAKEQEEAELYREMQNDVVAQVLRRLASVRV